MTRLRTGIATGVAAMALLAPAAASAATINVVAGMGEGGEDDQFSLREAISTANGNSAVNNGGAGPDCTVGQSFTVDTINLPAGTYTIAATSDENINASGDYDIQLGGGEMAIVGAGAGTTTIDANDHDRVMEVFGNNPFHLTGVTLTDGTTINNIGGGGGGLLNSSPQTVTLTDVDVTNNVAADSPGGGISTNAVGSTVLNDVTVTGNDTNGTTTAPGGGGISFGGGTSTIADSTISGNEYDHTDTNDGVGVGGGGIKYVSSHVGTITRTTIANNSVDTANPDQFPGGGGILHEADAGNLSISESTVSGNTVTGGNFRSGGGIEWTGSTAPLDQLRIDNTTISQNSVTTAANMTGGGIKATNGTVDIANATITNNTADPAGGDGISITTNNQSNSSTFEFRGSILDEGGANECDVVGINAAFTSSGHNIERGATNDCGFAGTGDQLLGSSVISASLASNGGPTQTHANLVAARDLIAPASCLDSAGATQANDQRGVPRPFNSNCDVGAYEYSECVGQSVNVVGTGSADVITGTAGNDAILALGGADTIDAGVGSDRVCAGEGDDTFQEAADTVADQILGEGGTDTISLVPVPANAYSVSVNSTGFSVASGGNLGSDLPHSFENAIGSAGNDALTGDGTANVLEGRDGDDTIDGGGGDDTLTGGEAGETNGDTMSFASSSVSASFDLAAGSPQNTGHGNDTWSELENALGGNAADTLRGDGANNVLNGGFGAPADTLEGRAGDDTIDGGTASDGAGDTAVYDEAASGVTVDLSNNGAQNTVGDGTDTVLDTESVIGSAHNDVLGSSSAANVLDGGGGNDRASFADAAAGITANLATDSATGEGADQLPGIEHLEGSANVDELTGDDGINFLIGGAGGDTLTGAGGSDTVNAGVGGDSILIRDNVGDTADCGPDVDADTVDADLMGTDTITSCDGTDTVTFDVLAPPAPTLTGTTPASGSNDNNPRVLGNAETGSTVDLYANGTCSGTPVQDDQPAAALASPGLPVSVPDNSTTTFSATATNSGGTSPCSTATVSYQEVTPAAKRKCKKGFKLKKIKRKGKKPKLKCVKKKRKK